MLGGAAALLFATQISAQSPPNLRPISALLFATPARRLGPSISIRPLCPQRRHLHRRGRHFPQGWRRRLHRRHHRLRRAYHPRPPPRRCPRRRHQRRRPILRGLSSTPARHQGRMCSYLHGSGAWKGQQGSQRSRQGSASSPCSSWVAWPWLCHGANAQAGHARRRRCGRRRRPSPAARTSLSRAVWAWSR